MKRLCLALLAAVLCGCAQTTAPLAQPLAELPKTQASAAPQATYGLLLYLRDDVHLQLAEALSAETAAENSELIVCDAGDDLYRQLEQGETLIWQQIDGVFLLPVAADGVKTMLESLAAAKIPVVNLDRQVTRGEADAFVGSSEAQVGQVTAQLLRNRFPNGCRATVFEDDSPALSARLSAFYRGMAGSGFYFTAAEKGSGGYAECYDQAKAIIESGRMVDAVVCTGEQTALAVAQAYGEYQGYRPKIYSMGGSPDAAEAVAGGRLEAVVQKPTQRCSKQALAVMRAIRAGEYYAPATLLSPEILQ